MLDALRLENFKAFKAQEIQLRPLTLLTGLNGMGKSSVLQALLLLRQSYQGQMLGKIVSKAALMLNGEYIQLGTGRDLLFDNADSNEIVIALKFDRVKQITWRFAYDRQTDILSHGRQIKGSDGAHIYQTSLFTAMFHYLQAERIGPRTSFAMADTMVRQHRQLGKQGEYAAHFLDVYQRQSVERQLHYPGTLPEKATDHDTLLNQVMAWLSNVSPGTVIQVESYADMDLVQLAFGFERPDTVGNARYYRSTNVGFGITYTLPVLLALLSAKPGALILLENPEAHLHPRGQAQIGNLLARAASAGIQVIVETHSDHILNGIRIAAREGIVNPKDVAIHFFQRPQNDSELLGVEVVTPQLDADGRIDYWPENFFDEYRKNLRSLL